nr:Chain C, GLYCOPROTEIN G1 [Lymphocytic choriomeningitis virus (strain WE)]3TBS_F Chain F, GLYCOPROTEIN G1 [Lymphocytic choriomeningitis virus (strain WE)]5M01_P Chain P, LCMV-DERIVED GP33 ALTERED PEPTIDE LIGAND PA [Mammarenavirus choriomeningitidis]
KAPANFATM